jgi:hypothetical protein
MNAAVFQRSAAGLAEKIGLHKPQLSTSPTPIARTINGPLSEI